MWRAVRTAEAKSSVHKGGRPTLHTPRRDTHGTHAAVQERRNKTHRRGGRPETEGGRARVSERAETAARRISAAESENPNERRLQLYSARGHAGGPVDERQDGIHDRLDVRVRLPGRGSAATAAPLVGRGTGTDGQPRPDRHQRRRRRPQTPREAARRHHPRQGPGYRPLRRPPQTLHVLLAGLRQVLHPPDSPRGAPAHSHRRAPVQVRPLRRRVRPCIPSQGPPAHAR